MMQQICALSQRVERFVLRAIAALAACGPVTKTTHGTFWNAMPSVHATAICTNGKRYEWRLREMPT
jgi:hypothetical protein